MVFALLLIFAALIATDLAQRGVTIIQPDRNPDCQQWKGHPFIDRAALGVWHLLHFKMGNDTGEGITSCARITFVNDHMRNNISSRFKNYVAHVNWDKLVFRLQIPCPWAMTRQMDEHFLEKLDTDGYFRTLTLPNHGNFCLPKLEWDILLVLEYASFGRYPMRMRMVEGKYLGMMDCYNRFVFLLGKRRSYDLERDDRLRMYIETQKWPTLLPMADDDYGESLV